MINQQLLDFIKSQLLKGVDKETITKELLEGGWTREDIEEGFSLANAKIVNLTGNSSTPTPPTIDVEAYNKGKKITYTIVSSIITIGIATGLIFGDELSLVKDILVKSIKGSKTEIVNQIKQEDNIKTQIQKEESVISQQEQNQDDKESTQEAESVAKIIDNRTVAETSPKTGPINCGTEMKCFIVASKTCTSAFVEETTTLDLFGMYSQTNKTKMTLTGYDSSKKCVYLSKVISVNIDYSSEIKSSPEYYGCNRGRKERRFS